MTKFDPKEQYGSFTCGSFSRKYARKLLRRMARRVIPARYMMYVTIGFKSLTNVPEHIVGYWKYDRMK